MILFHKIHGKDFLVEVADSLPLKSGAEQLSESFENDPKSYLMKNVDRESKLVLRDINSKTELINISYYYGVMGLFINSLHESHGRKSS